MEDFSAKVGEILGSPEGMQQLQSLAAMLGLGGGQEGDGHPKEQQPAPSPVPSSSAPMPPLPGGLDINTILLLQQAFSGLNRQDDNTQLLYALKPHLSSQRQKRVDDAVRLMQLVRLLPVLKESGLLEKLGLGLGGGSPAG